MAKTLSGPWWSRRSSKCFMMSLVTWWWESRTTGCISALLKLSNCRSLPPTQIWLTSGSNSGASMFRLLTAGTWFPDFKTWTLLERNPSDIDSRWALPHACNLRTLYSYLGRPPHGGTCRSRRPRHSKKHTEMYQACLEFDDLQLIHRRTAFLVSEVSSRVSTWVLAGHPSGGSRRNPGPRIHMSGFASSMSVLPLVMSSAGLFEESTYCQEWSSVNSCISATLFLMWVCVCLICFDVKCNKIRISLTFRCILFFHSNFYQSDLSSRASKDVFHLMSSTTTVAIDTISHLHVVSSNYSKITSIWVKFHIFCCSSVISTDIAYYDNSSYWALS